MRGVPTWARAHVQTCPLGSWLELPTGTIHVRSVPKWALAHMQIKCAIRQYVELPTRMNDPFEWCARMGAGPRANLPIGAAGGAAFWARSV